MASRSNKPKNASEDKGIEWGAAYEELKDVAKNPGSHFKRGVKMGAKSITDWSGYAGGAAREAKKRYKKADNPTK